MMLGLDSTVSFVVVVVIVIVIAAAAVANTVASFFAGMCGA
jgi:hypothetical protein